MLNLNSWKNIDYIIFFGGNAGSLRIMLKYHPVAPSQKNIFLR
jgi:hypothetical protein